MKIFFMGFFASLLLLLSVSCTTTGTADQTKNADAASPHDVNASFDYITLAWEEFNQNKNSLKALEYFDKAETLNPSEKQVFIGKIWIYKDLNMPDKAKEYGNKLYRALTENPVEPSFNYTHAADALAWGSEMPGEALELYGIQIKISNDSYSLHNRGRVYKELGDLEKAQKDLLAAYQIGKKANNPELAQWERDLVEVSLALGGGMYGLIDNKPVQMNPLYEKFLNTMLVYTKKSKGMSKGNAGFDWNADGTLQSDEYIPDSIIESSEENNTVLFKYLLDNFGKIYRTMYRTLNDCMLTVPVKTAADQAGFFDVLGSKLSSAGIHPYADKKIYYFPNGSGDKVLCRKIEFYPNGMPQWIKLEVPRKTTDDRTITVSIPSQREKVRINLYADEYLEEKLQGSRDTKGIYPEANEVEFWESGSLSRIGNFPFAEIFLPAEYGSARNPAPVKNIEWTKEGKIYHVIQAGEGNTYTLSDKMSIGYFYSITWMNIPQCKIEIGLENAVAVDLFFEKGTYTLYNEDPKSKQLIPYTKTFDKDTSITVIGGFWVNDKGEITRYWGEKK